MDPYVYGLPPCSGKSQFYWDPLGYAVGILLPNTPDPRLLSSTCGVWNKLIERATACTWPDYSAPSSYEYTVVV